MLNNLFGPTLVAETGKSGVRRVRMRENSAPTLVSEMGQKWVPKSAKSPAVSLILVGATQTFFC